MGCFGEVLINIAMYGEDRVFELTNIGPFDIMTVVRIS